MAVSVAACGIGFEEEGQHDGGHGEASGSNGNSDALGQVEEERQGDGGHGDGNGDSNTVDCDEHRGGSEVGQSSGYGGSNGGNGRDRVVHDGELTVVVMKRSITVIYTEI